MSAYLLTISIGPVQEFIAAGRKTRDLWAGSKLLSDVSRAVAQELQRQRADPIFPDAETLKGRPTASYYHREEPVVNKILVLTTADPEPLLASAEAAARSVIQARLQEIEREYSGFIRFHANPSAHQPRRVIDGDLLRGQIDEFLEFYAAWLPFDPDTDDYPTARLALERSLAGRKALREFASAHGAPTPKSSLDPSRESAVDLRRITNATERDRIRGRLRMAGGEQLDGISLVKRLAEPLPFPSVSRVAIDPFIRRVRFDPGLERLRKLAQQLNDIAPKQSVGSETPDIDPPATQLRIGADPELEHYTWFPWDTQLFYRDGERDLAIWPDDVRDQAEALVEQFRETVGELKTRNEVSADLPVYFAVLVADGDRMGAYLSAISDFKPHRQLSRRLTEFARDAGRIVAWHHGTLVYSGGDDVLAFLPLDTALPCADALRRSFRATVRLPGVAASPPTLSVGLSIGHYREHLQTLLRWGREAEADAKVERNSLAVHLHTHSGGEERLAVRHSWSEDPVRRRWLEWIDWHRRDVVPDAAAFMLRALEHEFSTYYHTYFPREGVRPQNGVPQAELRRLLSQEVKRVMLRRRGQGGTSFVQTRDRNTIEAVLEGAAPVDETLDRLNTLVNELLIARRIAAVVDIAEGPLDSERTER